MPHSFASLLFHVIFSTKNRLPDLSPELAVRLFPYMGGIVRERKGVPLIINGPADHVHLLVSVSAAESIAELLRVVKTNSSRWVHEQFPDQERFAWQAGYAAFTDRKSTRLNSSHLGISYAVFCLKKKIVPVCWLRDRLTLSASANPRIEPLSP